MGTLPKSGHGARAWLKQDDWGYPVGPPTARQKARAGAAQTGREPEESRSAPRAAARALAPDARGLRTATRPNKKHAAGTILALLALAVGNGTPAGSFPTDPKCGDLGGP